MIFNSCKIKQNVTNENQQSEFEKSYDYLISDEKFIDKILDYYQDLSDCKNLEFTYNSLISPIKTKDFPIFILTKTKLLNSVNEIDNLSFDEQVKVFDSIYGFTDHYIEKSKIFETKSYCEIRLTFSKKINNLLPIKFKIVDNDIDPRINYTPRIGLYIVEFNNENKIIDSGFMLMTN